MVIIYNDGGRFWIEDLNILNASVPANSQLSSGINLEKTGICVGIIATITSNQADEALASQIYAHVRNQITGGTIAYGTNLSSVGIRRGNNSASAVSFGIHVIVYMRKEGGI